MTRRIALAVALIAVALPVTAYAHAVLVKSSPARRAVLALPPSRVELTFNERLEAAYSTVSVSTHESARVDDGKVVVASDDPRRLSVGLAPLKPGTYSVKFRVLSVDGHLVEGIFPFEIRPR